MRRFAQVLGVVVVMVLVGRPASATFTVYTTLASWQAAAGASSLETFNSAAQFNTTGAFGPNAYNGFTLSGNGSGNNIGITQTALANSGDNTPLPASFAAQNFFGWGNNGNGNFISPITFGFTQATRAMAFDWFNTDQTDQYQLTLTSVSGTSTSFGPPFTYAGNTTASTGFFGVVSTDNLTSASISVQSYGGYVSDEGFDNVRLAPMAGGAVPEPSSLSLIALSGAIGAGLKLARRRFRPMAARV